MSVALLMDLTLAGCRPPGDTSMYASNASDQAWYLKVNRGGPSDYPWVVKVLPRAANVFALSWFGGPDVPVSVLALDCTAVGTFQPAADGTYVAEAVAGLTARIENGVPIGGRGDGILDTEDCGGFLFK